MSQRKNIDFLKDILKSIKLIESYRIYRQKTGWACTPGVLPTGALWMNADIFYAIKYC